MSGGLGVEVTYVSRGCEVEASKERRVQASDGGTHDLLGHLGDGLCNGQPGALDSGVVSDGQTTRVQSSALGCLAGNI
ncbi:hypothetical protein V6N11_030927 [Hibiscus sabdariffa]|uniref:Uncharacterized protein n=1 Tax=Hibiscus sabdariffa TaxID=183260 RepID=A0ABR2NRT0_9ROSI